MTSILILGFLIGMRHALETDHVAAVASLATRAQSLKHGIKQGAVWGLGHTLTLFLFGGIVLVANAAVPEHLAQGLEFAVGVMLVLLGLDVIRRLIRDRVHYHVHRHGNGTEHFHAHSHKNERTQTTHPIDHTHDHPTGFPLRALIVGLVHGMAGSAALILLTLQTFQSPWLGLAYIALFGVGSIVGMAVFSAVLVLPLQRARSMTRLHNSIQLIVGGATVAVGLLTIFTVGMM